MSYYPPPEGYPRAPPQNLSYPSVIPGYLAVHYPALQQPPAGVPSAPYPVDSSEQQQLALRGFSAQAAGKSFLDSTACISVFMISSPIVGILLSMVLQALAEVK